LSATKENLTALTVPDILARKGADPLVCTTAYTTPMAQIADRHCDLVLVGDSVGMVLHGLDSTVGVSMEMMILHGQAVRRGMKRAVMVMDMPFGSYEESREQAFRNAARMMRETGCTAIKMEGGTHLADTIAFLVDRGIPVMAHVGLTPQTINVLGGYKVQGRGKDAKRIRDGAKAVAEAGAFSLVLEKIPASLADQITSDIAIPTVGIGASAGCDGQILVIDDLLGLFTAFKPKFAKRYATLGDDADAALARYAQEVRARSFPGPEHVFADAAPTPKP
jgi:3-methyl-2-oxobutanoate hydroxymethyltransferase